MASLQSEVGRLLKRVAKNDGWEAFISGGGHWKVKHEGVTVAVAPVSPSDHRTMKNLVADLRRAGCPGL